MSEREGFEERIGAALSEGADRAPGVGGLAGRARVRARVRRRRTAAGVVVAAVLVVVMVSVPVALLRGRAASAPVAGADGGWRTVELTYDAMSPETETREVLVDVPAGWVAVGDDCLLDVAASADSCDEGEGVTLIADTGSQDFAFGPGLRSAEDFDYPVDTDWLGYVQVDDSGAYVDVGSDDRQTALRVLGSARTPGESVPDLSGGWPVVVEEGVSHPAAPGVSVEVGRDRTTASTDFVGYAEELGDRRWRARFSVSGTLVDATAPTQALAEVVAGSARAFDADEPVEAWTTRTVSGVTVDVPPGWTELGPCRDRLDPGPRYGPEGTDPCTTPAPLSVLGTRSVLMDGPPGLEAGFVLTGDRMVSVATDDPAVARRVLASARAEGEDPGDLDVPWDEQASEGVTWIAPRGAAVDVRVAPGYPDCARPQSAAVRGEDGLWRAGHCVDRIVTVTAPTQALADLVASTVDSRSEQDAWQSLEVEGVLVEVPGDWVGLDTSRCDDIAARFGPEGTDPCATPAPLSVSDTDGLAGLSGKRGSVFTGGRMVSVATDDPEITRRILASARVAGEDPGDLSRPWVERQSDGVTWSQPSASDVRVRVSSGYPACQIGGPTYAAERQADGTWRAFHCRDRSATVTAPTQALADLVASTVED